MIKHLTTLTLVILLAPIALADYHYASHTGSNIPPYTSWAAAADSIQKAIDAATAGDTIFVGAGIWENQPLNLWEGLALIGYGIDSTILRGNQQIGWQIETYSNTLVSNFTLENPIEGSRGIHCRYGSSAIMINNNKFYNIDNAILAPQGKINNNIFDNAKDAIQAGVVICNVSIENNTFMNANQATAIVALDGQWFITKNVFCNNTSSSDRLINLNLHRRGLDTAYFAGNLLYNNYDYSPILNYELIISSIYSYLENNTIIGFETADRFVSIYVGSDWHTDTTIIRNNVINGFRSVVSVNGESSGTELYYNNIWNNAHIEAPGSYGYFDTVIGNQYIDPMFADTTSFQLQAFSPCIDAGDPDILDVDGTRSDIGCYGGPNGCSYTYLDLAPAIPESIHVDADSADVVIRWHYNTEADFNNYKIYRDTTTGFIPSWENCIAEIETSLFVDEDINPSAAYYYRLSAVDNQHNESDYSAEVAVIPNDIDNNSQNALPTYTTIESVYPNPGNAHFTLVYSASNLGAQPPQITLKIYDIQGREIRTLADGRQEAGSYRAIWDGADNSGKKVASGVYFARVTQWGVPCGDTPIKVTIIK